MLKETGLTLALLAAGGLSAQDATANISADVTYGINQGDNIRLWPGLEKNGFKFSALWDVNKFFPFQKNTLEHNAINIKTGPVKVSPVVVWNKNKFDQYLASGIKASYSHKNGFGFVDLLGAKGYVPKFSTYHNVKLFDEISAGVFATGNTNDIENTYSEIDVGLPEIKNSGISPFARANIQKGKAPTYQVGLNWKTGKLKIPRKGR